MTQPVQEPTPDRAIAAAGWRTRQLARRPAIVNPETGAMAYAMMEFGPTEGDGPVETIPDDGDWQEIFVGDNWTTYVNPAGEVVLPGALQQLLSPDSANSQMEVAGGADDHPWPIFAVYAWIKYQMNELASPPPGRLYLWLSINGTGSFFFDDANQVTFGELPALVSWDTGMAVSAQYIGPIDANGFVEPTVLFGRTEDLGFAIDVYMAGIHFQQLGWLDFSEGTFDPAGGS